LALALGRRSSIPLIRIFSSHSSSSGAGFRLITVLFFATYMLPLFVPPFTIDDWCAALIGESAVLPAPIRLKTSAAACKRSPRGQGEAASALGLSWSKTHGVGP